jgi:hypothetical protein
MDLARGVAAADAVGNLRADGLEPSAAVQALLARWVAGQLSTAQLSAARRRLATGVAVADLVPGAHAS